jgi:hypothetical protein
MQFCRRLAHSWASSLPSSPRIAGEQGGAPDLTPLSALDHLHSVPSGSNLALERPFELLINNKKEPLGRSKPMSCDSLSITITGCRRAKASTHSCSKRLRITVLRAGDSSCNINSVITQGGRDMGCYRQPQPHQHCPHQHPSTPFTHPIRVHPPPPPSSSIQQRRQRLRR